MKELNKITKLRVQIELKPSQINWIWKEYKQVFNSYPLGPKTCSDCQRGALKALYQHYLLQNIW